MMLCAEVLGGIHPIHACMCSTGLQGMYEYGTKITPRIFIYLYILYAVSPLMIFHKRRALLSSDHIDVL